MTLISEATRIRLVRALLGMNSRDFAHRVGVSAGTMTAWEKGRSEPSGRARRRLAQMCQDNQISFLPSGMPVPTVDALIFKEQEKV